MADSSCLWSALHSVRIKNLLPDESGVELERRVESEVERRRVFFFFSFLMETSIWQGHGPSSFISICGLSLISCPPVYLPHLSAGRCLRYTNFMTDPSPIKKEWVCNFLSHTNTHIPVRLTCPSVRDSVVLFGCLSLSDDRPVLKCQPTLRAKEKHYTAAPCHAGRHHPRSGFNFSASHRRGHRSARLFVCARNRERERERGKKKARNPFF